MDDDARARQLVRRAVAGATPAPAPGFRATTLAAVRRLRSEPAAPRRPHGRLLAALATLTLAAVAATAMAYPPARVAISRLPGLGTLGGLYGAQGQRPATLAEATSGGYTLRVTAGYDDGTTVVLAFDVTPAGGQSPRYDDIGWAGQPTATDSSGHVLDSSFTPVRSALSSNLAYTRPPGGPAAGTPVSLEVTGINLLDPSFPKGYRKVSGHWTHRLSIRPSSPLTPLAAPAAGPVLGGTVTFSDVRANDAYVVLRYTLTGITPPPGLPAGKGYSPYLVVYGPDGSRIAMLTWGNVGDSLSTFIWKGQLARVPGAYRLVFEDSTGATMLQRTIVVPWARSAALPAA
jgi:hypothetical protein